MTIAVQLYARARDIAGCPCLLVPLPEQATVGDLRRRLAELLPNLAPLLARSALAVDNEWADDEVILSPDAGVALLPPVSGG
jgi:molybdopterin converting factor small subunit